MKIRHIQKTFLTVMSIVLLASCKKESENIFNMFDDVTVTYNASSPMAVTEYKLVNDGDEVWIDFTINSAAEDMYTVVLEKSIGGTSPDRGTTFILTDNQRRAYSNVVKLKMARDGKNSYRVYALNKKGYFIGDGYKKVTIEQNPSYAITLNKKIYLPDTVEKVRPAFFSISEATAYSYTDGKANSAKIDFGIYRKPSVGTVTEVTTNPWVYNLYSISTPISPLTVYDVSTWEKRTTKFAAPQTGQATNFANNITSGSTIETLAKARNPNLTLTSATAYLNGLAPGNTVAFLTPEGKYGVMLINSVYADIDRRLLMDVSYKMQR
jgi:hypothetical protein